MCKSFSYEHFFIVETQVSLFVLIIKRFFSKEIFTIEMDTIQHILQTTFENGASSQCQ